MNLNLLAWNNIRGSAFRSLVVALSALLVASFAVSTTMIMRGAENSLRLALERLGADILVVPQGAEASAETALLMGVPAEMWMPESNIAAIAAIPGVEKVSPQIYLTTLEDAACCSAPNMFLVVFDPATDFTITPWLKENFGSELKLGEVVGGHYVFTPEGAENILIYGYFVTLLANMEPTGTGLDQTMFFTLDTARDISRISYSRAVTPLVIPENQVSAIMVKVAEGAVPAEVAIDILQNVPNVTPIESPNMFQAYRKQMSGLLSTVLVVMGITWTLSVILIGLVFSMAANERRRELGVLRALGATRGHVLRSLLAEAGILALVGGSSGVLLAALGIFVFRKTIVESVGVPFIFPSLPSLLLQVGAGIALTLISVTLAALLPAYRISRMEPSNAMRE